MENLVHFTQLDYMNLQTFIIHCFLAVIILGICCLWAYDLNRRTHENIKNIVAIEDVTNKLTLNLEFASQLAAGAYDEEIEVDANDPLGSVLLEIQQKLKERISA
jgi:hypothetical protein